LRGGSGNFGIVTSFTFQLHPVGPMVVAGLVAHPMERAVEVLRFYRRFVETIPDEINTIAGFSHHPRRRQGGGRGGVPLRWHRRGGAAHHRLRGSNSKTGSLRQGPPTSASDRTRFSRMRGRPEGTTKLKSSARRWHGIMTDLVDQR